MSKNLPPCAAADLPALLDYDAASGRLTWKARPSSMFTAHRSHSVDHIAAKWNGKFAGKPALASIGEQGYACGSLLGQSIRAHVVIWALMTGEWPPEDIDHWDGDHSNNAWDNMRAATRQENTKNAGIGRRNTTGTVGVYRHPTATWTASIGVDGKSIYLGAFKSFEAAASARRAAEQRFGFHPNNRRSAPQQTENGHGSQG